MIARKSAVVAVLAAVISASACPRLPASAPTASVKSVLSSRVGPAGMEGPIYCRRDRLCGSGVLPSFYRDRDFRPAWIDDALALGDARAFLDALRRVAADGLEPENYHLSALGSLLGEIAEAARRDPREVEPDALADLEMLLTDAFLLCGSHLVHGQVNPETIQSEWFVKGRVADLAAALEKGLASKDVPAALDALRPGHAVYRGLLKAMRDHEAVVEAGGWPGFPAGPELARGDRGVRVEALRRSLAARGESPETEAAEGPDIFDDGLEAAVRSFQRRHGLEPDGVVGAEMAAALNISAAERLTQIRANLERWRWITQDLGERYILVNVADFRLGVVEEGREVLAMPVVVGTAYRRTPDFSGTMSYLELSPAWTVPPKLAREDILPKVVKDTSYLRSGGFHVFESWAEGAREIDPAAVDWARVDPETMPYKFRQDPGPLNAMGRIKFMFPNKFDVYLHDTPERWPFQRAVRPHSSGCIRVERPVDLAEYVLRGDPAWTRDKILAALESPETLTIMLPEPLRVHLLYWTAWLGDDGRVQFRQDIYLRDAALNAALKERASGVGG